MLTAFGKAVRKMRIDRGLKLKDMADAVGRSSAYLSAVETGRKEASSQLLADIVEKFEVSQDDAAALRRAADESRRTVRVQVTHARYGELAAMFARNMDGLDEKATQDIMKLLRKAGG